MKIIFKDKLELIEHDKWLYLLNNNFKNENENPLFLLKDLFLNEFPEFDDDKYDCELINFNNINNNINIKDVFLKFFLNLKNNLN
jgi:hypothetical protein